MIIRKVKLDHYTPLLIASSASHCIWSRSQALYSVPQSPAWAGPLKPLRFPTKLIFAIFFLEASLLIQRITRQAFLLGHNAFPDTCERLAPCFSRSFLKYIFSVKTLLLQHCLSDWLTTFWQTFSLYAFYFPCLIPECKFLKNKGFYWFGSILCLGTHNNECLINSRHSTHAWTIEL